MSDIEKSYSPLAPIFGNIFITQTLPCKTQPTNQTCTNIETSTYEAASTTNPSLQWTLSNICFIGYQWCDNSVISTLLFFHRKEFMCWAFCFLRTKYCFTCVDTLIVKTAECENSQALHENSLHSSNLVFIRTVSKTNSGTIVIWRNWKRKRGIFDIYCKYTMFIIFLVPLKN